MLTDESERAPLPVFPHTGPGSMPSLGLRLAARLFDFLVLSLPWLALHWPYLRFEGTEMSLRQLPHWVSVLAVVIPVAYEVVFLLLFRATPGKLLFGMRVAGFASGGHPNGHQLVMRAIVPFLGSLLTLAMPTGAPAAVLAMVEPVVFGWVLFDPYRRGWHDRAAGTVVLRV
ncbi:MAG: RDD family protein [Microthrixaceae bacterium]